MPKVVLKLYAGQGTGQTGSPFGENTNGAFWCYLKQCFGSWNCLENFESKEAKWCILPNLKCCFGSKWNCLENVETKEAK